MSVSTCEILKLRSLVIGLVSPVSAELGSQESRLEYGECTVCTVWIIEHHPLSFVRHVGRTAEVSANLPHLSRGQVGHPEHELPALRLQLRRIHHRCPLGLHVRQ